MIKNNRLINKFNILSLIQFEIYLFKGKKIVKYNSMYKRNNKVILYHFLSINFLY